MRLEIFLLAAAFASTLRADEPANAADSVARIARVENGLLPPARIAGALSEPWTLPARMVHYHVPGVSLAIIDRGEIAWARGYSIARAGDPAPVTPDTLFQAGSLSKPVTAAVALALVKSGRLALDTDVNATLKSWKIPAAAIAENEPVTLRRLLSHTAGLTIHGFDGYAADAPRPTLLQILDGAPPANSSPVRIQVKPGTAWRYSGGGYCVVQQLLIDATGEDFPTLLRERVLLPAGMTASTFEQPLSAALAPRAAVGHDADGQRLAGDAHIYPELAAAGLWTTPTDLAHFALALQHSLAGDAGAKIFSRATAETMLTVPLAGSDYALGLGVKGTGENILVTHDGANAGFRALLVAYPRAGRGAVIMTNSDNGSALIAEILRAIAREYGWPDYQVVERTAVPLTAEAFDAFFGRYERDDITLRFFRKENHFYLRASDQPRVEIFPSSDHEFFLLDQPDTFAFERDATGQVTHVIRRTPGGPQVFPRVE